MGFSINYIETCYPDYLQDHHHREGEALLAISLASQTPEEAVADLLSEVDGLYDMGLPELTPEAVKAAALDAVDGVTFHPYDEDGTEVTNRGSEAWDKAAERCESMAYFYAAWDTEEEDAPMEHHGGATCRDGSPPSGVDCLGCEDDGDWW